MGENVIRRILIHHSYTQDLDTTFSWRDILLDHMGLVPWSRWLDPPKGPGSMSYIGYQAGNELMRGVYTNMYGRPEWWVGGHCVHQSMNSQSFGFCFIGNFDDAPPCEAQLRAAVRGVIAPLYSRKGWPLTEVGQRIVGHGEITKDGRSCPGKLFPMETLRTMVKEELT